MLSSIDRLKDQLKSSDEDCQRLKQKLLVVEQKLIDTESRLNKSEQSVMSHDGIQEKLNKRFVLADL